MKNDFKVIYRGVIEFLAAIFVIYLLFFRKKKRKSPKSYASDPGESTAKRMASLTSRKRGGCAKRKYDSGKTITLQLLH
ncbi:hypothetical protein LNP74_35020 [Klebsiella pneumoniae subsp. pneumoniae]|nr:hypothetical protein [Klebsiella pneumoniae subsp. pneumoniae]